MTEPQVPLLDLSAQNGPLEAEIHAAIGRVVSSNQFIMGPEVAAFEAEVARAIGVEHAIGVSSGTDALLAALMSLGIGRGDEVVTSTFSFFATGGTIARTGARPVFVDIDDATFNLDPRLVGDAITDRTRAIMPVHLFGQPCDMQPLREIAASRGVSIIEDAAQAIGARHELGAVGTLGAYGCFSFFPSKNLGGLGDGGLVTTNDAELAERARVMRVHGGKPKYHHALVGGNFRLDALQAAVLRVKLPHLDAWTRRRRENAALYDRLFRESGLESELLRAPERIFDGHVFNQYVVRSSRRDALEAHLRERKIGTAIYYPIPLHLQACFADLGYREGDMPVAERACREALALPVYPELTRAQIVRVVETVAGFLRS